MGVQQSSTGALCLIWRVIEHVVLRQFHLSGLRVRYGTTCQLTGNGFSFFPPEEVVQVAVEEALRRLITQIFAGRCRIIVIRRELPRTICAG